MQKSFSVIIAQTKNVILKITTNNKPIIDIYKMMCSHCNSQLLVQQSGRELLHQFVHLYIT